MNHQHNPIYVAIASLVFFVGTTNHAYSKDEEVIESIAYLYQPSSEYQGQLPAMPLVIRQPDTIRILYCNITAFPDPTPEKLQDMISSGSCHRYEPDLLVSDRARERYVVANANVVVGALTSKYLSWGYVSSAIVNLQKTDSMAIAGTYMTVSDDFFVDNQTARLSFLKIFEAAISYPVISEKPEVR